MLYLVAVILVAGLLIDISKGFEALGSEVKIEHGLICASAEKLVGTSIYFDESSVGATINVMLAAIMAEGQTTIENAAKRTPCCGCG